MFRGKASTLALIGAIALAATPGLARERIPLPKPRPAQAPQIEQQQRAADESEASKPEADAPQQAEADRPPQKPEPKPLSACRLALTEAVAIAPSIADITGPGGCGGPDLVRLEAVVLSDGSRVAMTPPGTMRCAMASEVAAWIRSDLAPLATSLDSKLVALDNFDSYDCRGRNRVRGAKLSEHGRANALDLRGFKLANGRMLSLTDRASPRAVREAVLQSVCARFSTVLGPGSDGYHEDHIHLDLAQRRGGYKMCQWDVWEPLPQIAPLLPAERPAEAPPRQVADNPADKPADPEPDRAAPAQQGEPQQAEQPEAEQPPPAKKSAKKKRRSEQRL